MALNSLATLKKTNPGLPACIVTNKEFNTQGLSMWDETIDHLVLISEGIERPFELKTAIYKYSPFNKTIFLDCDTVVIGDISMGSYYLDSFDYGVRLNQYMEGRFIKNDVSFSDKSATISQLPHWNTGVVLFKKGEATDIYFRLWAEHYKQMGTNYSESETLFDQASHVEAVFRSPARMLSLDYRWNFHPIGSIKGGYHRKDTLILHYTSRISDVLYTNLLQVCEQLGYDKKMVHNFVKRKRQDRKKKVGLKSYFFLWLKWKLKRGEFY